MPVGRMYVLSWILFVVFLFAVLGVAGGLASAGSPLVVPVTVVFVSATISVFVYAMYLSQRAMRGGDPRLLARGIRGTAIVLAAKQTNTIVRSGDFAWQAPWIWKYHLRVSLPETAPYETDCSICIADLPVGGTVKVAAAPHNRKRVTIDVGQDQRKQRRRAAHEKQVSVENALRDLVERRERGELTHDEFEAQKTQLLRS